MTQPSPSSHVDTPQATTDLKTMANELQSDIKKVFEEVENVVVGLGHVVEQILISILASGHVLVEGVPGIAKTSLLKTVAAVLGCDFNRIQFTPDLLPSDITGTYIFQRNKGEFELRKGPIFTQIMLADEINRAPAKTQSALLEAMQEYQVTIEGKTFPLDRPFVIFATQNPVEQEGVYRLPEAQLDRFFLRIVFSYLPPDVEKRILQLHSEAPKQASPILNARQILAYQAVIPSVFANEKVLEYIVSFMNHSRQHPDVLLGGSPRAGLCLLQAARARAFLQGRAFVTHDDIKSMAGPVLNHRFILKPEAEIEGRVADDVVAELLQRVPVFEATAQ